MAGIVKTDEDPPFLNASPYSMEGVARLDIGHWRTRGTQWRDRGNAKDGLGTDVPPRSNGGTL